MNQLLPGLLITFFLYLISSYIKSKIGIQYINKYLIAAVIGIAFMLVFKIPYETYKPGGDFITFFLSPMVVILAIPLYRNFHAINKHKIIFMMGCMFAVGLNFALLFIALRFFAVDDVLKTAIYTKSITGAMAMALNETLGADPSLAILLVSFAGITGGLTGGLIIKWFKIKSTMAKGIGMGAVSHLVGSMTIHEHSGEEAGAVASTTLGTVGIMTAILLPLIINYL